MKRAIAAFYYHEKNVIASNGETVRINPSLSLHYTDAKSRWVSDKQVTVRRHHLTSEQGSRIMQALLREVFEGRAVIPHQNYSMTQFSDLV